jgi:hypothetical protein
LHNGCTTGVEAFLMDVPAISYRESVSEEYDNGFYRLPNALSHQCFNFDQLQTMLRQIFSGELGAADGHGRQSMVAHYLEPQTGPLACEKMVDVLVSLAADQKNNAGPSWWDRIQRRLIAEGYHLYKRLKPRLPGSHNKPEFQRHRYPGISLEAINSKIERIQHILKDTTKLKVEQLNEVLFRMSVRGDLK